MGTEKKESKREMSKHISESHKMAKGYQPGEYKHKGVLIDTRTCKPAEAEAFMKLGSKILVKISPAAKAETKANKK